MTNLDFKLGDYRQSRPNLAVSISRWPGLNFACVLARREKIGSSPAPDFRPTDRNRRPKDWLDSHDQGDRTAPPLRSPRPALHFVSQVPSLRGTGKTGRVKFEASPAPRRVPQNWFQTRPHQRRSARKNNPGR
jgi:hypothetical protein